jgi:hypothetical protein
VRAIGIAHNRSTYLGSDDIGLYVRLNVKSFISYQVAIDSICVNFDPVKAECNPLASSNNEVLNRRNEVPVTSGVMEDTSDLGCLAAVTADLLSHINLINRFFHGA